MSLTSRVSVQSYFSNNSKIHPERYSPYNPIDVQPEESISLHAWNKIAEWRAEKKGSIGRKIIAELGYFGSGITGIVEIPFRLTAAYIIGNPISKGIAKVVNFVKNLDDETLCSYYEIKKAANQSCDKTVQGVVQNFASIGTNIISHELNMKISGYVHVNLEGKAEKVVEIIEAINPSTIAYAIYKKDSSGIAYDISNAIGEEMGVQSYDPRITTHLVRLVGDLVNTD